MRADSDRKALLGLHISIAISMYLILVGRIGWRLFNGRPRVLIQQSKPLNAIGLLDTHNPVGRAGSDVT